MTVKLVDLAETWRREAAKEQRVSFCANELDAALVELREQVEAMDGLQVEWPSGHFAETYQRTLGRRSALKDVLALFSPTAKEKS